jgi:hypothetical protein
LGVQQPKGSKPQSKIVYNNKHAGLHGIFRIGIAEIQEMNVPKAQVA